MGARETNHEGERLMRDPSGHEVHYNPGEPPDYDDEPSEDADLRVEVAATERERDELRERLAILHDACDAWEFRALKAEREGEEVAAAWREALHQNALLENENDRLRAKEKD